MGIRYRQPLLPLTQQLLAFFSPPPRLICLPALRFLYSDDVGEDDEDEHKDKDDNDHGGDDEDIRLRPIPLERDLLAEYLAEACLSLSSWASVSRIRKRCSSFSATVEFCGGSASSAGSALVALLPRVTYLRGMMNV